MTTCEFCQKEMVESWESVKVSGKYSCTLCYDCLELFAEELRTKGWYPANIKFNFLGCEDDSEMITMV